VAIDLQRPLLAIDLPGHGHSSASPYGLSSFATHADDLAVVLERRLEGPRPLVGMSLGGLTSITLAHRYPHLVSHLVLVDITPGVTAAKARHITAFVNGPATFNDFEELVARTMAFNPTRSESSLRRGILHNALQRPDGTWVWRHQQHGPATLTAPPVGDLWAALSELETPVTLIRGMREGSVVTNDDETMFLERVQRPVVHHVDAGHSVQGDAPRTLAALLREV
jgi:pimeloyl-ACP methyl ester carboxylesterase